MRQPESGAAGPAAGIQRARSGPDRQPSLPAFEYLSADDERRGVTKVVQDCNWLQSLEGGIDTSHAPILHRRINPNTTEPGISLNTPLVQGSAPTLEVDVTDYGYRYFGVRNMRNNTVYARGYHFLMWDDTDWLVAQVRGFIERPAR